MDRQPHIQLRGDILVIWNAFALHWCHRGVTIMLQWRQSDGTVMLQWCYSGLTLSASVDTCCARLSNAQLLCDAACHWDVLMLSDAM
jgi:hypothetical protein